MKMLSAFARFWYDFIVGDSPVLAVGSVATLGAAALLARADAGAWAQGALPVIVALALAVSLRWPQ